MLYKPLLFCIYLCMVTSIFGDERSMGQSHKAKRLIRVGLEVTPGLLEANGKGVLDLVLRDLSKKSKLYTLSITYLPYLRAKIELEKGNFDLIGLTPQGHESQQFYKYADELKWKLDTNLVLFCSSQEALKLKKGEQIGSPIGNEAFTAKALGIKVGYFETGSLRSLLKRLSKKRLPCLAFEEISTLRLAKEMGVKKLYFRIVEPIPASFAFRKRLKSDRSITEIDSALQKVDWSNHLSGLLRIPRNKKEGMIKL